MSLRKLAGLLAVAGLSIGLIGGGVGAVFHDQVTATEDIAVGTFGCQIVSGNGTISNVPHTGSTITYDAPQIVSSAADNAPFTFTVQNVGTIPQQLTITASPVGGTLDPLKFSAMTLAPASPVNLAGGVSQALSTGIQWTALDNGDLGSHGSVTWTVNCGEVPAAPVLPANTYDFASTNAQNITNGWANVTAVSGVHSVTLTFSEPRTWITTCFEYRTDGDVPEQRLGPTEATVGPPFMANYLGAGINDGLYKYVCPGHASAGMGGPVDDSVNPTVVTVPVSNYVEVRQSFGGETDQRFDWTRFDALP